jgi:ELWxxDGT repeat protein
MPFSTILLLALATARVEPLDDAYLVADLDTRITGTADGAAEVLGRLPGGVLASALDRTGQRALWFREDADGAVRELVRLSEAPGIVYLLGVAGERAYLALGGLHPTLWSTDGSVEGTQRLIEATQAPIFLGALPDGSALFSIVTDDRGGVLWRSDGTRAGTRRVAPSVGAYTPALAGSGGVYFQGYTQRSGVELWFTDGTRRGTRRLTDLVRGPGDGWFGELQSWQGDLLFLAIHGTRSELWRSDGSVAGTRKVADVGPASARLSSPAVDGETKEPAMFAPDGVGYALFNTGHGLWRTDGIASGTFPLTGESGAIDVNTEPAVANGIVYFGGFDEGTGAELWRTDGTRAGTWRITDLCPGPCSGFIDSAVAGAESRVAFVGYTPGSGRELWASDGRTAGTHRLADICPGECDGMVSRLIALQGTVFGTAKTGWEVKPTLWRSRGTRRSTYALTGPTVDRIPLFAPVGQGVCFAGSDAFHGTELWCSNGTSASTRLAADLDDAPFGVGSHPHDFAELSSGLVYAASDGLGAVRLWHSDGTPGNATPLGTVATSLDPAADVRSAAAGPERAYYTADGATNHQLWATDGTPAGTAAVWSGLTRPTVASLGDGNAVVLADAIYVANGDPAGTTRVADLRSQPSEALALPGDRAVFAGAPGDPVWRGLWTSDGTAQGTFQVSSEPLQPVCLTAFGTNTLFASQTASSTPALWLSDGETAAATVAIADWYFEPLTGCSPERIATTPDHQVYFAQSPWTAPWFFDGISSRQLAEVGTGRLGKMLPFGNGALVQVEGAQVGLWFVPSNGEAATPLTSRFVRAGSLLQAGERAYFANGPDLWSTDATPEGTVLVASLGELGDTLRLYPAGNDELLIMGNAAVWTSDGTAAGTVRRGQFLPRHCCGAANVGAPVVINGRAFFAGTTEAFGEELWAIDLP